MKQRMFYMIVILACFAPTVNLVTIPSTFIAPIELQRNQDLYVDSTIELHCDWSQRIKIQWVVMDCSTSLCNNVLPFYPFILTNFTNFHIPAKTLPLGLYEIKVTVHMAVLSNLSSSSSIYVRIISSGIAVNLFQYGTSIISSGSKQDLELNPGRYSLDFDGFTFNATVKIISRLTRFISPIETSCKDWDYQYYCRIYGVSSFPSLNGSLLTIDNPFVNLSNHSCFEHHIQSAIWPKSFLIISNDLIRSNRTYQFMVSMRHQ